MALHLRGGQPGEELCQDNLSIDDDKNMKCDEC